MMKRRERQTTMTHRKQLTVFFALLAAYALSAFLTYSFFGDQLAAVVGMPLPDLGVPDAVLGLANAGIVLLVYGFLGLEGYWFARRLGLPGILNEDAGWRRWFFIPLQLGLICGIALIVGDMLFARFNDFGRFVHPDFPASLLVSLSAGIGEEIAFRGFFFGLVALILNWLFKRALKRTDGRSAALWTANVIAALAFGAGHLGSLIMLTGATSLSGLNPFLLVEVFLLNGIVGLVAGKRYMTDGLVAAAGVHFWTDVVFHVLQSLYS